MPSNYAMNNVWIPESPAIGVPSSLQRTARSALDFSGGSLTLLADTAYFVYLLYTTKEITVKHVEWQVQGVGSGSQTAECGLFSTPNAPSKAAQTLTKLTATGTLDALTSNGAKRNTTSLAYIVPPGVHLWAGIRTNMATTQPGLRGLTCDFAQGHLLELAAAGALTASDTFAGVIPAVAATAIGPDLRIALD